jgi:hypothetical protein
MRAILVALVTAGLASACFGSAGGHSVASTTGGTTAPLTHYRGHGVAFDYPAAWGRYRRDGFFTTMTSPVVDLSTQPTVDPCIHTGSKTSCWFPVRHMRAGSVVVMWIRWEGPRTTTERPPRSVRVKVIPGGCRGIGGDEIIDAQITTRHHEAFYADACLRAPGLAANERAFRAMARSAVATT